MGFWLLLQDTRELWKEWEMRLLVLLSLFLQLTLATQVSRRKSIFRHWIHVMVWTTYLLAESVASLSLGILSSRLANIQETNGTINPKSQIMAFWAPFLLLHLGGPDTVTAYVLEDNELWLKQLAQLCVQVGLACFIYFMALWRSTLSVLALGMILVGLMKHAERILCLYRASNVRLRDSNLVLPDFVPTYPRTMERYNLKKEEGYRIEIEEVIEVVPPDDFLVDEINANILFIAHKLFKTFKLLSLGFIRAFRDLKDSKRMFMNGMDSVKAFRIVEIELGLMYDLLYTKAPLLNCAWGIIRWAISLSVSCAVLVFFSLLDKKDYAKVDTCITFLLVSVVILSETYSLLLAISLDSVDHWRLQRPRRSTISSATAILKFSSKPRWSNSVAQISLLDLSIRKRNRIYLKCPMLAQLDEKLVIFDIGRKAFKTGMKQWIFDHMKRMVVDVEQRNILKSGWTSFKKEVSDVLRMSNRNHLNWTVKEMEFDQSVLLWHIATELCYYRDRHEMREPMGETIWAMKMSKLVSRYMVYLILFQPSMLPTGIGVLRYKDTSVHAQKFFEDKLAVTLRNEDSVSSINNKWKLKLFKKQRHIHLHTGVESCKEGHKSRQSRDLCELRHLLRRVNFGPFEEDIIRGKSRSVLFGACHLTSQLNNIESDDKGKKRDTIGKVWVKLLIYAAHQCKGREHCERLSRGGELLTHIWLLMAHLGIVEAVEASEPQSVLEPIIRK